MKGGARALGLALLAAAAVMAAGLFFPETTRVERRVSIDAPVDVVLAELRSGALEPLNLSPASMGEGQAGPVAGSPEDSPAALQSHRYLTRIEVDGRPAFLDLQVIVDGRGARAEVALTTRARGALDRLSDRMAAGRRQIELGERLEALKRRAEARHAGRQYG